MASRSPLLFLVILLSLSFGTSWAEEPGRSLRPEHLVPGSGWSGPQFLQADQSGNLALLRGETLEVCPLASDGALGPPEKLSVIGGAGEGPVMRATMSGEGDWMLRQGVGVRLFRAGKEEAVASPVWDSHGLAFLQGDPVISGTRVDVLTSSILGRDLPQTFPLLLRWRGDRWETLVDSRPPAGKAVSAGLMYEEQNLQLASSSRHLWAAFEHKHRFREYSADGRLQTEIIVGTGEPQEAANAESQKILAEEQSRVISKGTGAQVTFAAITAQQVAVALTEGRDGRMYFLVEGRFDGQGPGMTLERYDPASMELQRVAVSMPSPGMGTMAAAKDGLYIAAFKASQGIWRISWEDLDSADWQPVPGVAMGVSDPSKLEGVWREKGGRGLVRFAKERVITWEDGRLTVRGLVSLEGTDAVLRRSGFGERWKLSILPGGLRIERDGGSREYTRLAESPAAVSLDPAPLGTVKELAAERVRALQSELDQRVLKARQARESADPNQRLAVDADNIRFLRNLTAEVGWIDARRFGGKASSQATILAQNSLDILLMLAALPKVEKDLKHLPEGGPVFASFYDSLQVALGGKQRYGTQIAPDGAGEPVVLPLERRAEVDAARRKLGLPPLPETLAALSSEVFQGRPVRIAEGEVVEPLPAAARQAGSRPAPVLSPLSKLTVRAPGAPVPSVSPQE